MKGRTDAHRTDFVMRCACGNEFHTDDAHLGRKLQCRCGRVLTIARPDDSATLSSSGKQSGERKRSSREAHTSASARNTTSSQSKSRKSGPALQWSRRFNNAISTYGVLALHDFVHPKTSRRWATRLAWFTAALMLLVWFLLTQTSEYFLPATLLAYGPRVVVFAPIVLLVPWVAISARRALLPLVIASWVAYFPVMGARLSLGTISEELPSLPGPGEIRIVTFNVLRGGQLALHLNEFLEEYSPDILTFQECESELWSKMQRLPEWHVARESSLCTASRWPLTMMDSMIAPPNTSRRNPRLLGGYGSLARYRIDTPKGPMVLVNLHLPTARYGLQALMKKDDQLEATSAVDAIGSAARDASGMLNDETSAKIKSNFNARAIASERASMRATSGDARVPVIVAGDFNLPVESTIYRDHWSQLTDAFEEVGNGLGYTKREGSLIRIRIDHVLTNEALLQPARAVVGRPRYSDHLPVIVDLKRK